MNALDLLGLAARRVHLRMARSVLLSACVFLTTLFTACLLFLQQGLTTTATRILNAGPSLVISNVNAGGWASIDAADAKRVELIAGVVRVVPRVWGFLPGPPAVTIVGDDNVPTGVARVGRGVPMGTDGSITLQGLDGQTEAARATSRLEHDLSGFDTVELDSNRARALLLLPPGGATDLAVYVARQEEEAAIAADIAPALGRPVRVVTRAQMLMAYQAEAGKSGATQVLLYLPSFLAMALVVLVLATGGATARADVGRLKMLGWTTGQVSALLLTEVAVVTLLGSLLGLTVAYGLVFIGGAQPLGGWLLGWRGATPSLTLDAEGTWLAVLQCIALSLAPCAAASVVPAVRLARTDPLSLLEGP